ncbi:MAG: hypothetical protein ACK46A_14540 [Akkermansiaceae bacterium]|jgi:hypothetical protein
MKITEANVLEISAFGSALYWILGGTSFAYDYATGDLNTKSSSFAAFVFLSAFCGIAFYLILAPTLIRSIRSVGNSPARKRVGMILLAISPLPMLVISASLVAYAVFRSN